MLTKNVLSSNKEIYQQNTSPFPSIGITWSGFLENCPVYILDNILEKSSAWLWAQLHFIGWALTD